MAGSVSKPRAQPPAAGEKAKTRALSALTKTYLLGYNFIQTTGWSYLLYQLVSHYLTGSTSSLWDKVYWTVMIFQNAAVLEIFHAAAGLVQSNVAVTTMQVYSRVFLVLGILCKFQSASQGAVGLPLSILAWSLTEIIRYSFYGFNLLGGVPKLLVYLRYTLFIALYPIGITGELLCMFYAQQEVAKTGVWTVSMPNAGNFIFNFRYFLIIYMLTYIPFFPMLYGHMWTQRKKVLGGGKDKKKQ